MFNSNILDVAVGLVFFLLLISLISSAANELIEAFLKQRAAFLEKGIEELVGGAGSEVTREFMQKLYNHGLINALYHGSYEPGNRSLPSYIPAANFALAVLDLAQSGVELPPNIRSVMNTLQNVVGGNLGSMRKEIENWYNSSMDRVSGWYKRRSQYLVLALGVSITVVMNADCIMIAKRLSVDTSLRASAVRLAENAAKQSVLTGSAPSTTMPEGQSQSDIALSEIRKNIDSLSGVGFPLGWDPHPKTMGEIGMGFAAHWIGWLITALAVSLGAPFWFDVLNKIIVVRSTVKPSEKSGADGSKDARTD